jgi:DNA excision repair protein ERCC-2
MESKYLLRFDNARKHQEQMINDIYRALEERKDVLANAPTGIGKTDASIAAALSFAIKNDLSLFFLTPKISQHKIVVESLSGIRKKFGIEIRYADMVGKINLCVNDEINSIDRSSFYKACEEKFKNNRCIFYNNAKKYEGSELPMDAVRSSMEGHRELYNYSSSNGLCAYEIATQLSKQAKMIIADYAHVLNPYTRTAFMKKIAHRLEDSIIIWDEAHNIPALASSYMSNYVSSRIIERAIKELDAISSNLDIEYLNFMLKEIAGKRLNGKREAFVEKEDLSGLLANDMADVSAKLEKAALEFISNSGSKRSSLMHISRFIASLASADESVAKIIRSEGENMRMSLICLYPSEPMRAFDAAYANIFMSGTMLPLEMYRDLFGLKNVYAMSYSSPFPKENRLCFIDSNVSTKYERRTNEEYAKIASRIGLVREKIRGNMAVFFPSFEVMKSIFRYMGSYEIYSQREGMHSHAVDELLSRFKSSSDSMLFGVMGGSLSEGVNYADNLIKCAVIVGIPLPKPDLEINSKIEYMNKKFIGKGRDYAYLIPGVMKAVQAAGRAIRSEKDRAAVIFMDNRYEWSVYKKMISNFIPISESKDYVSELPAFFSGA